MLLLFSKGAVPVKYKEGRTEMWLKLNLLKHEFSQKIFFPAHWSEIVLKHDLAYASNVE